MLNSVKSNKTCQYVFLSIRSQVKKHARFCHNKHNDNCKDSGTSENQDSRMSGNHDFFTNLASQKITKPTNKISVVGCGYVGMACAISCLTQGITSDLCLYDINVKHAQGEALDLQHASLFLKGEKIHAATKIEDTANSKVIIITAGARQKDGEKRPELIGRNMEIFKAIVPELAKYSPDSILIIITNPCDPMTYVAWKLSGFPVNRVIGSGTTLDSARLRFFISEKMNVNVANTHAFMIGEHGDSSVPVWSGVNVAGVPVRPQLPKGANQDDPEHWGELHKKTVSAAYDVIKLKGYTSWAIGFSAGRIAQAIMNNLKAIHPVSTSIKGHYGVEDDVFVSIPSVVAGHGITAIVNIPLTDYELELFKVSIDTCREMQLLAKL